MTLIPVVSKPVTLTPLVQAKTTAAVAPPKVTVKRTGAIDSPYLRLCLYGDIGTYKTTIAAHFSRPEATRIVLTRGEDQLLPIRSLDIPYVAVNNIADFQKVAMNPVGVFGKEWGDMPDRTLIFDDITRAKDFALDANDDGQNNMVIYREATKDIGSIFLSVFRQPQHVIAIALAASYENDITHKENLTADLPPAMRRFLLADFSYVFYCDRINQKLLTAEKRDQWQGTDEKMRPKTLTRTIFARHKLPQELVGKGIIEPEEPMDLAAIWKKVQEAKSSVQSGS